MSRYLFRLVYVAAMIIFIVVWINSYSQHFPYLDYKYTNLIGLENKNNTNCGISINHGRVVCWHLQVIPSMIYINPNWPRKDRFGYIRTHDMCTIDVLALPFSEQPNGIKLLHAIWFPIWVPAVLLFLIPMFIVIKINTRKLIRQSRNQCTHCGYNLTGNISGICPECGSHAENTRKILTDQ